MLSWYIPLLIFIIVAGFTPGPNNIIALNIGFNFGFKKVVPHIFGVAVGFPIMLLVVAILVENILYKYQYIFVILKYLSSIYLLYLAYIIATSSTDIKKDINFKPISFYESLLFQWINPKAWAGAIATISLYIPHEIFRYALNIAALTSAVVIIFAISLWAYLGQSVKLFFKNSQEIRFFNYISSSLLILSIILILFS